MGLKMEVIAFSFKRWEGTHDEDKILACLGAPIARDC